MTKVTQNRKYYNGLAIGLTNHNGSYMRVSARQTALECAAAGVDRTTSWSCWLRFSNIRNNNQRVFNVSNADSSNNQYAFFLIGTDNTNATNNGKARFTLFTNNSNVIEIQTSLVFNKNRNYHIVITYTGSEASSGLKIYINGVEDASAVKTTTGTYTGGNNQADLRFKIGHETSAASMLGDVRELTIWDEALTSTEVTELYNNGIVKEASLMSFYASKIISYWPLKTDNTSIQNSAFNLSVDSSGADPLGVQYGRFSFNVNDIGLSFKRVSPTSTRYLSFGNVVRKNASTVSWFGFSGTAHPGTSDAYTVRIDLDIDNFTAGSPVIIIDDATYSMSGIAGGKDSNGDIHLFGARYNIGGAVFVDARYYKSTDNGDTFVFQRAFSTSRPRFEFYGQMVPGFAAGEYFVPFFEHTSATTWTVSVFKTTDYWATETKIQVFDGTSPKLGEACIWNCGNNRLLMLSRQEGDTHGIWQVTSSDGGATWSTPVRTNLTATTSAAANAELCQTDNGKLCAIFMDRALDLCYTSKDNNIDTVFNDPTAWRTPVYRLLSYSADSTGILGYPNIINIGNGNVLAICGFELSASRADLVWGIGSV